ncbi:tRNA (N6-threonylcarbamoyladenosine(37)-N6)-methyltransferase TrmO [Desulfoluna sp.]|uniref:tRNA (N6-threonylcarbamoyladenosine(37)-N6)-methyltransferase TrmO n=1 Tax=Desulfoluna sp. TaxID=2045199 RepID=UPI002625F931|nr:tRNA (N6-threonylcarbamoyladenosine(37)-N6)-methyltransferase TrmO [Desulfoluna sp.]
MEIHPIGTLHTPHTQLEAMPIQPKGALEIKGQALLHPEYIEGLNDLDGFSHIYLIYHFHKTTRTELTVVPFMDTETRGVFSTRSPLRPTHIGMSIVRITKVTKDTLHFTGADMLDGTPLLDIKPYIENFDHIEESTSGWMTADKKTVSEKRSDNRFV